MKIDNKMDAINNQNNNNNNNQKRINYKSSIDAISLKDNIFALFCFCPNHNSYKKAVSNISFH